MSWNRLVRVTAPIDPVVSLDDVKSHLHISHSDDDELLERYIAAATAYVEGPDGCGLALLTQTWRMSADALPGCGIMVPLHPVQSVTSITYRDTAGATQTLDSNLYVVDLDRSPLWITPAYNAVWPCPQPTQGSVKVTFEAGYGDDPSDVPADLISAVLLLVQAYFDPENADKARNSAEAILNRYRAAPIA